MRAIHRLQIPLLAVLLVLICWQPLAVDSDFWAHAAVGRWIAEHGQVPHSALFIWTYNGPWMAHSWLSELGCYGLMELGGEWGGPVLAVSFCVLAVLCVFGIALWPVIKEKTLPTLPALLATLAAFSAANRFVPRPEIFTTLFMTVLYAAVYGLRRSRDEPSRRDWVWCIPFMFVLWTNLHGAVIYGLAGLWIAAICDFTQFRDQAAKRLLLVAAVSTACIAVNPYGVRYLLIYMPLANHSFSYIDEWRPFWAPPHLDLKLPVYEAVLTIAAAAAWSCDSKRRWSAMGWLTMAAAAFLQARRNMDLLAVTALIVFAHHYAPALLSAPMQKLTKLARSYRGVRAAYSVAAVAVALNLIYVTAPMAAQQSRGSFVEETRAGIPEGQIAVVNRLASPNLRLLNVYNSSAYLEWDLGRRVPLCIDGLNAYPLSVYTDWWDMWEATPDGIENFDRSGINCVIGQHIEAGGQAPGLFNHLVESKKWLMIYNGPDGSVFVRAPADRKSRSMAATVIIRPSAKRGA